MIGDYFLDQCLISCVSVPDEDSRSVEIIQSIFDIFKLYKTEMSDNIKEKNEFTEKFDLVYFLSQYRNNTKNFIFEEFVDKLANGKFSYMIENIKNKHVSLENDDVNVILKRLRTKKKMCELLRGKKSLQNTLNDIESGNYLDEEAIINKWESEVNTLHSNMMRITMMESRDKAIRLNLMDDDYTSVMNKLRESLDEKNTLKTGYGCIDNMLPSKGLENRRLYLIGGSSGVGKSIFLVNLIINALKGKKYSADDTEYDYYLYITAENLIDESLLRTYCCLTEEPSMEVIDKIKTDLTFSMKPKMLSEQIRRKTKIEFQYVEPGKTTVSDIENLVKIAYEQSRGKLKAVALDYLDCVKSDIFSTQDDTRKDQGEVSRGFKNIAVTYNIPFITATQLNRSGYDVKAEPSLTQMGESMLKINNSDFVLFLQNSVDKSISIETMGGKKEYSRVRMTILKNRNGSVGNTVHLGLPSKLDGKDIFNYKFEELPDLKYGNQMELVDYSDFS